MEWEWQKATIGDNVEKSYPCATGYRTNVLEKCLNKHEPVVDVTFSGKDSQGLRLRSSSVGARLSWLASDTRQISERSSSRLLRLY
jgi:hypothetical protein